MSLSCTSFAPPEALGSELEIAEELFSDVVDHEGRYVLLTEVWVCECGSPDGYALPGGEITCAVCFGYEGFVEISELARRRWLRRERALEQTRRVLVPGSARAHQR